MNTEPMSYTPDDILEATIGEIEYSTNPKSHSVSIKYKNGETVEKNMSKYDIYKYLKQYIHHTQIRYFKEYFK